ALLVGMTASRLTWIRDEGVAIATTAIFVLGSGFENQEHLLTDRVVEVLVGVGFGLAVNLMIIPPLRDRQAARHIDSINRRMGAVLEEMAQEFSDSWGVARAGESFHEVSEMGDAVELASRTVSFARESSRANPRWYIHALRRGEHDPRQLEIQGEEVGYEELLQRVDESISHLAELTRTLRDASYAEGEWDTVFRERWARIVRDAGRVIADPDAEVEPVKHRLDDLAVHMSQDEQMPDDAWPLYGSSIMSMRSIAVIVDDAASAREAGTAARETPTPWAPGSGRPSCRSPRGAAREGSMPPQARRPSPTMCSGRRSLLPYMKWFSIRSEKRLASVTRPAVSATSRMWIGAAPQHTPR